MKRVVYIFIMCSLAILLRTHAEAQEQNIDSVEYNREAERKEDAVSKEKEMETMRFLLRSDSAMLSANANILRAIDSTMVDENQKEYYKYLLLVLDLSEAVEVVEAEHQELLALEKQCAEKKKELSLQVPTLISTINKIVRAIKASKQLRSKEHEVFINNILGQVRALEARYVLPSKPKKKGK